MFSLQGSALAKQLGAEAYLECSAFTSEKSIHSVFRTSAMACLNKLQPLPKPSPTRRLSKRLLHLPSKSDLLSSSFKKEKTKSCSVMWVERVTGLTCDSQPQPLWFWGRGVSMMVLSGLPAESFPHPPETKSPSEEVDTLLSTCSWTFQRTSMFSSLSNCFFINPNLTIELFFNCNQYAMVFTFLSFQYLLARVDFVRYENVQSVTF